MTDSRASISARSQAIPFSSSAMDVSLSRTTPGDERPDAGETLVAVMKRDMRPPGRVRLEVEEIARDARIVVQPVDEEERDGRPPAHVMGVATNRLDGLGHSGGRDVPLEPLEGRRLDANARRAVVGAHDALIRHPLGPVSALPLPVVPRNLPIMTPGAARSNQPRSLEPAGGWFLSNRSSSLDRS
jgi:hypothetical protein